MLRLLMTRHPRYQHLLEDLFVQVYVFVDDWLAENEARFSLPKQPRQVASYSESFTIALVGELVAQPYESVWYWLGQAPSAASAMLSCGGAELPPALSQIA